MNEQEDGVKDVSEVVSPSATPADQNDKEFEQDVQTQQEEAQPTDENESHEDDSAESNKGANARIRELAAEKKAEKERADSLAKQIQDLTGGSENYDLGPIAPYSGEEATAEEVEARAAQRALAVMQLNQQKQQFVQRVQQEASEVISEHHQLDPDHELYDPDLSEAITQAGLAYVSSNPGKSLKTYVNKLMAPYKRSVQKEVGNLADTVTRQAAEKALRPTSSPKGEKRPEDMSIEELEAKLGTVY